MIPSIRPEHFRGASFETKAEKECYTKLKKKFSSHWESQLKNEIDPIDFRHNQNITKHPVASELTEETFNRFIENARESGFLVQSERPTLLNSVNPLEPGCIVHISLPEAPEESRCKSPGWPNARMLRSNFPSKEEVARLDQQACNLEMEKLDKTPFDLEVRVHEHTMYGVDKRINRVAELMAKKLKERGFAVEVKSFIGNSVSVRFSPPK